MYRRLIILSLVILAALSVFFVLGLQALGMHAQGLQAKRGGEFVEVAQQIRRDVKRKLDAFMQAEQQRPFADYQHYYVPDNVYQNDALLVSPLAEKVSNGLAYGYFQIDAAGHITSPHAESVQAALPEVRRYLDTVEQSLLPVLGGQPALQARRIVPAPQPMAGEQTYFRSRFDASRNPTGKAPEPVEASKANLRRGTYKIELEESQQPAQVLTQNRAAVERTISNSAAASPGPGGMHDADAGGGMGLMDQPQTCRNTDEGFSFQAAEQQARNQEGDAEIAAPEPEIQIPQSETVQVRIEPFTPMILPAAGDSTIFNGHVYLLRHVQIERNHFLQGFRLDQVELTRQIRESAERLIRRGMDFEVSLAESASATHTAVLDFGFGDLVLNLTETDPAWLAAQIARLRSGYFAVTGIVAACVLLALASLARNMQAQLRLAHKKDDFISAVSHELRTPLTSIRMYTEMLEKDWVPSEERRREYYAGMRQESERLSRLIENVLDFSRIQRRRKQYNFVMGNLNECVESAVRMFMPCARQAGFEIRTELAALPSFAFDRDAVVQIVVNLLDNAVKYAVGEDRRIIVRTLRQKDCVLLEVEDRGPGIPRRLHGKVFEEFFRCSDESTRETTGTGLGLALVRKFAQAHDGFVSIAAARPRGTILRVGLRLSTAG